MNNNYQKRPAKHKALRISRNILIVGAIVFLLAVAAVTLAVHYHKNRGVIAGKPVGTSTASQNTKGEPAPAGNTTTPAPGNGDKTPAGGTTPPVLATPQGTFVSNHHPNLGGSPAPNTEQSVCNTNPGATCQITFTKDGVTKSLASQTADSGGAVYWSWKLQDIGLTEGTWQITASASSGGQTKTASDALTLQVAP